MDVINIGKIINDKNVKKNLPTQFNKTEQISTVYTTVYTLTKTIQSKIFNQKEFIKTLDIKYILDNMNNLPCNCTTTICRSKPWAYCKWRHTCCPKKNCESCYAKVPNTGNQSPLTFQIAKLKQKITLQNIFLIGAIKRESLFNALDNG